MGYWQTLFDPRFMFDSEWKQRRDIEEDRELAVAAHDATAAANVRITQLQKQVHDLSVTVMALVEALADAGRLDSQELRARVEAAMIGERAAARAAAAQPAPPKPYVCIRCEATVAPDRTTMTANGVVCDNCAR